jgi:hypothetical protein
MANSDKERRKFLKQAFGLGSLVWLTPAIVTLSAKKGHARLSGYNNITEAASARPRRPRRPRPRPTY